MSEGARSRYKLSSEVRGVTASHRVKLQSLERSFRSIICSSREKTKETRNENGVSTRDRQRTWELGDPTRIAIWRRVALRWTLRRANSHRFLLSIYPIVQEYVKLSAYSINALFLTDENR